MGDIAHQFGFKEESTWGTLVTVDRFLEFNSETMVRRQNVAMSNGIRSGRRYRGSGRRITRSDAGGPITFEIATKGFGAFFKLLLGDVDSVNTVGTVWTHTFTPGTLTGKSWTLQKGIEKPDGTVQAFTYNGVKIVSMDLSNDQDGLLMGTFEFDSKSESIAVGLAAASYTDPVPFTYAEGLVKKDGATVASVRSVPSLRIQNNLLTERNKLGSAGLKDEQINVPFDSMGGTLDVEFQNLTDFYNAFAADSAHILILKYTGGIIEGAHNFDLQITMNNVRFEGETPTVSGPELVYQSIPFVGLDHATLDAVEIIYKTTDAAP